MNAIFDVNRFINYMKRNVLISKGHYIYLFGTLIGAYFFGLLMYMMLGFSLAGTIKFFLMISILFGPSLLEKNITKYNGVMEFTFPVSTFERFFSLILRYSILYPLIAFGSYYLLNILIGNLPVKGFEAFASSMSLKGINYKEIYVLLGVQSIFLLGYLSFSKNSFIKTCFSCIMVSIGITILSGYLFVHQFKTNFGSDMLVNLLGTALNDESNFSILQYISAYFFLYLFPLGMWVVGYFKLREKEI